MDNENIPTPNEQLQAKRGPKPEDIDPSKIDEVLKLFDKGIPMKYIAILLDISVYHIKKLLKANGKYVNKYESRSNKITI